MISYSDNSRLDVNDCSIAGVLEWSSYVTGGEKLMNEGVTGGGDDMDACPNQVAGPDVIIHAGLVKCMLKNNDLQLRITLL